MELVTTDEIIARLRVPGGVGVDQLPVIDAFRLAIQERVLAMTGFLVTDDPYFSPSQQTEEQADVQLGISRLMQYRPIIPMSNDPQRTVILRARSLASNTLDTILGDIRDKKTGRIMPLASELTPVFPPVGGQAPWFRWRQMIWPTVSFTYLVDPLGSPTNPVPASLRAAVLEWSAFLWAIQPFTGRLKSFTAEKVSETYENFVLKGAVPPVVYALLAPYIRGRASLIF